MNINNMPTNPTIAATRRGIIRASGLLHCACCGQPLQAFAIENAERRHPGNLPHLSPRRV
jgi:hypothetical protein